MTTCSNAFMNRHLSWHIIKMFSQNCSSKSSIDKNLNLTAMKHKNRMKENALLTNELSSTPLFTKMFYNTVIKCFWIGHHTFQLISVTHFWPWAFPKYVFTLFSVENECSTDPVEYGENQNNQFMHFLKTTIQVIFMHVSMELFNAVLT